MTTGIDGLEWGTMKPEDTKSGDSCDRFVKKEIVKKISM